jgi:RNA polymerase sigma factor (sigma-70 family)
MINWTTTENWKPIEHPRLPRGSASGGRFVVKLSRKLFQEKFGWSQERIIESCLRQHRGWIYSRYNYFKNSHWGALSKEEFECAALLGAVEAAKTYNPHKANFPTWSLKFIDGAIKEEMRERRNIVHIPEHQQAAEGPVHFNDVDFYVNLSTPDFQTEAEARMEEAAKNKTLQFRTKKVMRVLKKKLTERQLKVFYLTTAEQLSTRQIADALRVSNATVSTDYHTAKAIIETLVAKDALKSQVADPPFPSVMAYIECLHRTARLMENYQKLKKVRGVPLETMARVGADLTTTIRKLLVYDRWLADRLLHPPDLPE